MDSLHIWTSIIDSLYMYSSVLQSKIILLRPLYAVTLSYRLREIVVTTLFFLSIQINWAVFDILEELLIVYMCSMCLRHGFCFVFFINNAVQFWGFLFVRAKNVRVLACSFYGEPWGCREAHLGG